MRGIPGGTTPLPPLLPAPQLHCRPPAYTYTPQCSQVWGRAAVSPTCGHLQHVPTFQKQDTLDTPKPKETCQRRRAPLSRPPGNHSNSGEAVVRRKGLRVLVSRQARASVSPIGCGPSCPCLGRAAVPLPGSPRFPTPRCLPWLGFSDPRSQCTVTTECRTQCARTTGCLHRCRAQCPQFLSGVWPTIQR